MKEIILQIKIAVINIIAFFKYYLPNRKTIVQNKDKPIIYLLDVPTYTNLGDQAIAYAERKYIEDNFTNPIIVEVYGYMMKMYFKLIKKYIKEEDILILIGGGNFGDQYLNIESTRKLYLKNFKNNKICIFPQTIYYSNTPMGKKMLNEMKRIIKDNKKLLLITREQQSYEFAKEHFLCDTILCPDIVLYLNKIEEVKNRDNVLICLRNDIEKRCDFFETILNILKSKKIQYEISDTWVDEKFDIKNRENVLNAKWNQFSNSKLVITDRLHGMIFAAITRRPCLVFPNYNHKITSFYNTWFQNINFIIYLEEETMIEDKLNFLLNLSKEEYSCIDYSGKYNIIKEFLFKK